MTFINTVNRTYRERSFPLYFVIFSALLTMISLSFFKISFIVWISEVFLILYFMTNRITAKKAFWAFFLYGALFNLTYLHWLLNLHPLTWMGYTTAESLALTILAWFFLSLFEALFYALIGFLAFIVKPSNSYSKGFLAILVILMVEWIRGAGTMGFPWGRLALSQYQNISLIQSASIFGILFVSFIILLVNFSLALAIYALNTKKTFLSVSSLILALVLFFGNMAFGYDQLKKDPVENDGINVSIIQGNVSVDEKWVESTGQETVKEKHFRLTREAIMEYPQTDFVFWAESAVPENLTKNPGLASEISMLSADIEKPLIIGAVLYDENNGLRNSIISIDETGIKDRYFKRHPVPFGEFIPFKEFVFKIFPKARDSRIAGEGLVAGKSSNLIDINGYDLGALVCYDSIFPGLARDAVKDGADLIFVASNDSWYKKSVALDQLVAQSVYRAVENRRYLVRAANTGISAIIDPHGKLLYESIMNEEEIVNGDVFFNSETTYYTKTGDIFMFFMLGIFILTILYPLIGSQKKFHHIINGGKGYN